MNKLVIIALVSPASQARVSDVKPTSQTAIIICGTRIQAFPFSWPRKTKVPPNVTASISDIGYPLYGDTVPLR